MALTNIEYGSIATSKVLNDNFNYLEDKIEDYSKNIETDKSSLVSLINSQIETINTQFTAKLQTIYPIGAIYIGTTDTCPIASLFGTWEKISEGRVLQGASETQIVGTTVEAGLPNVNGSFTCSVSGYDSVLALTNLQGAFYQGGSTGQHAYPAIGNGYNRNGTRMHLDASRSNPVYGKSNTVQPPAYLVNIWRRTA